MPTIERFTPRELGPKPWGTELLVAHTPAYIGKVLTMRSGAGGALQYHERKDETFYLFSGQAWVYFDDGSGEITRVLMEPGMSFHVPPGAVHQVEAVSDCVFFEASTTVFEDRVHVGPQYGRADPG